MQPSCGNPNCPWIAVPEQQSEGTYYVMDAKWCFRCARLGETLLFVMRRAFASAWSIQHD